MPEDNVFNRCAVGMRGERVVILRFRAELSKLEALNLAAWIVALADDDDEFKNLLQAVRNT